MLLNDWEYNPEHEAKNDDWVPGYRTFFKIFNNKNTCGKPLMDDITKVYNKAARKQVNEDENEQNIEIDPARHQIIRKSCNPRFYSRYNKEFRNLDPNDAGKSHITTIGIPYTTPQNIKNLYDLEKDKDILFNPTIITGLKAEASQARILKDQSQFYKSSQFENCNYNKFAKSVLSKLPKF